MGFQPIIDDCPFGTTGRHKIIILAVMFIRINLPKKKKKQRVLKLKTDLN